MCVVVASFDLWDWNMWCRVKSFQQYTSNILMSNICFYSKTFLYLVNKSKAAKQLKYRFLTFFEISFQGSPRPRRHVLSQYLFGVRRVLRWLGGTGMHHGQEFRHLQQLPGRHLATTPEVESRRVPLLNGSTWSARLWDEWTMDHGVLSSVWTWRLSAWCDYNQSQL